MKKYVWNLLVAFSIVLGSLFFGTYKRSLSSNLGEIEGDNALARGVCKVLDVILQDPDHCKKEYEDYKREL